MRPSRTQSSVLIRNGITPFPADRNNPPTSGLNAVVGSIDRSINRVRQVSIPLPDVAVDDVVAAGALSSLFDKRVLYATTTRGRTACREDERTTVAMEVHRGDFRPLMLFAINLR